MQTTETMTVEEWVLNELLGRGLRLNQAEQALDFAKRKLDGIGFQDNAGYENRNGQLIKVRDCWNTPASDYTKDTLKDLRGLIEHHTFTWLVNQLQSRL